MTFPLLKNPSNYLIEGGMGHARSSCFRVRHFVFFRHAQNFIGLAIGNPKTTSTVCLWTLVQGLPRNRLRGVGMTDHKPMDIKGNIKGTIHIKRQHQCLRWWI